MEQLTPGRFERIEKALWRQCAYMYEQPYGYTGTEKVSAGASSTNLATEEPSALLLAALASLV